MNIGQDRSNIDIIGEVQTSTGSCKSISMCQYDQNSLLFVYVIENIQSQIFGRFLDIQTVSSFGNEFEIQFSLNDNDYTKKQPTCQKINNDKIGITFSAQNNTIPQNKYDVYYTILEKNTQLYNDPTLVNLEQYNDQQNAQLMSLKDIQVVLFQGEDSVTGNPQINLQNFDPEGNSILQSNMQIFKPHNSQIYNGKSSAYGNNSEFLSVVWEQQDDNSSVRFLMYATFNNLMEEQCRIQIAQNGQFPSVYQQDNQAFIIYMIHNTAQYALDLGKQEKQYLMAIQVSVQDCDIQQEAQIVTDMNLSQKGNTYSLSFSKGDISNNISIIINQDDKLYLHEYYFDQIPGQIQGKCKDTKCTGCYNNLDELCHICAGSNYNMRQMRKTSSDLEPLSCNCQEGYYHDDHETNCQICPHQCLTCSNQQDCIICKNDQMLLPSCVYPIKGYLHKIINGVDTYPKCDQVCEYCVNEVNECQTCNGLNRNQDANCKCKDGFHDNDGWLQDCIPCNGICLKCNNNYTCTECKDEQQNFRQFNKFSKQCECIKGYQSQFQMDQDDQNQNYQCQKCFMLSDICVDECPKNTYTNEEKMICEPLDYQLNSNFMMIVFCGGSVALTQVIICLFIYKCIRRQYFKLRSEYQGRQAELKQKRQYIYKEFNPQDYQNNQFVTMPNNFTTHAQILEEKSSDMKNQIVKKGYNRRGTRATRATMQSNNLSQANSSTINLMAGGLNASSYADILSQSQQYQFNNGLQSTIQNNLFNQSINLNQSENTSPLKKPKFQDYESQNENENQQENNQQIQNEYQNSMNDLEYQQDNPYNNQLSPQNQNDKQTTDYNQFENNEEQNQNCIEYQQQGQNDLETQHIDQDQLQNQENCYEQQNNIEYQQQQYFDDNNQQNQINSNINFQNQNNENESYNNQQQNDNDQINFKEEEQNIDQQQFEQDIIQNNEYQNNIEQQNNCEENNYQNNEEPQNQIQVNQDIAENEQQQENNQQYYCEENNDQQQIINTIDNQDQDFQNQEFNNQQYQQQEEVIEENSQNQQQEYNNQNQEQYQNDDNQELEQNIIDNQQQYQENDQQQYDIQNQINQQEYAQENINFQQNNDEMQNNLQEINQNLEEKQ